MYNSEFVQNLPDPEVYSQLRAAAIASQHTLYVFDLDDSPSVCNVFVPFAMKYRVNSVQTKAKKQEVKTAYWSCTLGRDPLPKDILLSSMYRQNRVALVVKHNQKYFSCAKDSALPHVGQSQLDLLGLKFVATQFEAVQLKKSAAQTTRNTGGAGDLLEQLGVKIACFIKWYHVCNSFVCSVVPQSLQQCFQYLI